MDTSVLHLYCSPVQVSIGNTSAKLKCPYLIPARWYGSIIYVYSLTFPKTQQRKSPHRFPGVNGGGMLDPICHQCFLYIGLLYRTQW